LYSVSDEAATGLLGRFSFVSSLGLVAVDALACFFSRFSRATSPSDWACENEIINSATVNVFAAIRRNETPPSRNCFFQALLYGS
jgi:hypothetical protein